MAENIAITRCLEQLSLGEYTRAFTENRTDASPSLVAHGPDYQVPTHLSELDFIRYTVHWFLGLPCLGTQMQAAANMP